jgi:plastocyanin
VFRRALLVAALAAGVVAVAVGAAARTPRTRTVEVADASLKPTPATIGIGDSVTWLNTGRRKHRVISDTSAWTALSLAPKQGGTVKFSRVGTYRYHVDGRRQGIVKVEVARAVPPPKLPPGVDTWSGTFRSEGTVVGTGQTCSATWKGTLRITVSRSWKLAGRGSATMSAPACSVKLPAAEVSRVTFTLDGVETWETTGGWLEVAMHPLTVTPAGYDAGGFLVHFGSRGEGIPLALAVGSEGANYRVDSRVYVVYPSANTKVTLDDHFQLKLG